MLYKFRHAGTLKGLRKSRLKRALSVKYNQSQLKLFLSLDEEILCWFFCVTFFVRLVLSLSLEFNFFSVQVILLFFISYCKSY